jgi:SNF2 family DNA or RNA helicase
MKVSASKPFQIIYSIFQHEYLGYLFESFVVQLDEKERLTFQHQNISAQNAAEFSKGLDQTDFELIGLMDSMQQDAVVKHFNKKSTKAEPFFMKVYDTKKGNELLQREIDNYVERRRVKIMDLLKGKMLYEMGNDGEPAWRKIEIMEEKATVLFHFRRDEENTYYFPTIKHKGEKVEFQYKGAYLISTKPAWLAVAGKVFSFEKDVDGKKIQPFLNKKFIVIPRKVEETYYNKFVAPLIASFDVYAKGFEINTETYDPQPQLTFTELAANAAKPSATLFDEAKATTLVEEEGKLVFELVFRYGTYKFKADLLSPVSVSVEKRENEYIFHRVNRKLNKEKEILQFLKDSGLEVRNSKALMDKSKAFSWMSHYGPKLTSMGFTVHQRELNGKRYFMGESSIKIEVKENIDWFDIHALVRFGEFQIPFADIRKLILRKKKEFILPNGEIAVIPDHWVNEYSELFHFVEDNSGALRLKKHHLALIEDLERGHLLKLTMDRKLQALRDFDKIEDFPSPKHFKGDLRPYQKAGYNWLLFLHQYKFGGCLADDMGLGKTVQTLAMLQMQKEMGVKTASLLIMPTSLVYNWEREAKKFTPKLKVFVYTGTQRNKDISQFEKYDLVLTSYGIARLDTEILKNYYFHYIILDESQAIKNPGSNIAKSVNELISRYRLILTGTPLENSTLDLWSQMNFVNPGLLGSQVYFKNEYLKPIEKFGDEWKTQKLYSIIKPFVMRRHKSQVATELPEKIDYVHYCTMTEDQEVEYNRVKEHFRNRILNHIDEHGLKQSQFILLQGLTQLRQLANHPRMVMEEFKGDSGKMEDVTQMLENAIKEDHKILVFSQFVKHLTILREYLEEEGITYSYLDGSTRNREEQVNKFQNNPEIRVFLISIKAGGVGLNLTKADYVFILDPWWNPAVEAQAVDRAHRIGQENKVFNYKFITKDTVEEKILALQGMKMKLAKDLITTEESFVKSLSKTDIENLFV